MIVLYYNSIVLSFDTEEKWILTLFSLFNFYAESYLYCYEFVNNLGDLCLLHLVCC